MANALDLDDDGTTSTAVTNLNGDAAAALLANVKNQAHNIGTVNVNGDVGGATVTLTSVTGGTVNFNKKQTYTTNAVDLGAATMNFNSGATDSKFGAATLTAAAINIGTDDSNAASVTFDGSTFGGATKATVNTGSTMIVGANGLIAGTGDIKVADDATLVLEGVLNGATNGAPVDFAYGSVLKAGDNLKAATDSKDIITFSDITAKAKLDGGDYDAGEFQSYLDQFATTGLNRNVAFSVNTNAIKVSITDNRGEEATEIIGGVMESQGVGDMTEYAKPLADDWQTITNTYTTNPTSPQFTGVGKETAKLITKLAEGGFRLDGDVRGAEAATSFLTGMDMAKSVDAAGQTAHRAVGNVFKRIQQNNTLRTAANDAFGSGSAYANSILNADYANRFWLGGMGMWEDGKRHNGNAGYDYDAYGIQLGYDRVFGALTVGGSFAYANGDYEDNAALANDSEIENYTFNLYGTFNHCSGFFASIIGGYTYSDYAMNSSYAVGQWNKADYGMDTWTIGTTLGYDIRPVANFTITPSVGLYYYASESDIFNSTGLRGIQIENDYTELPLALSMKYDMPVNECAVVSFEVNGGYTYNFSDEGGKVTALGYNGIRNSTGGTTTLNTTRHSYNVGAGVSYSATRWDAGLKYDYYTSKASKAHVLRAEVGFKF